MRKLVVPIAFALILAACGGDAEPAASPAPTSQTDTADSAATTNPETTSTGAGEQSPTETAAPDSTTEASGPSYDGPAAPDFELALSDGSTFRLSDEQKPVYMVFWAEW